MASEDTTTGNASEASQTASADQPTPVTVVSGVPSEQSSATASTTASDAEATAAADDAVESIEDGKESDAHSEPSVSRRLSSGTLKRAMREDPGIPVANSQHVLVIPHHPSVTADGYRTQLSQFGTVQKISQMRESNVFIVSFDSIGSAQRCLASLHSDDHVTVRPPSAEDFSIVSGSPSRSSVGSTTTRIDDSALLSRMQSESRKSELEVTLEEERRKAMSRRQERVGLMYEQRQCMELVRECDEAENVKRETRLQLMADRINTMNDTAVGIYDYLNKSIHYEKDYRLRLKKEVSGFGVSESGTVRQASVAIDTLHQNAFEQWNDMFRRVSNNVLDNGKKYSEKLSKQQRYFFEISGKVGTQLNDSRKVYFDKWMQYESELSAALNVSSAPGLSSSMMGKSSSLDGGSSSSSAAASSAGDSMYDSIKSDPFLVGKEFEFAQRIYKESQCEYNSEMSRLFRELVLADGRRIDELKSILLDYFLCEKSKLLNQLKMLDKSIEYIKNMDRETDTSDFMRRGEFLVSDASVLSSQQIEQKIAESRELRTEKSISSSSTTSRSVSSAQSQSSSAPAPPLSSSKDGRSTVVRSEAESLRNIFELGIGRFAEKSRELSTSVYRDVLKWGHLRRPGRIIAANWKPMFAIVTKFGFFHGFETKEDLKPFVSIPLAKVESEVSTEKQYYLVTVSVPNQSWLSLTGTPTKHVFRVEELAEAKQWLICLRQFNLDKSLREKGLKMVT